MIPREIQNFFEEAYGKVLSFSPCSGGSINNGGKVETKSEVFFLKWNSVSRFPEMFTKERHGLELLQNTNALSIPNVLRVFNGTEYSCLILEYIESGTKNPAYWEELAYGLATIHRTTAKQFGLDRNNYIGSLEQSNKQYTSWIDFFINERLSPQVHLALVRGAMERLHANLIEDFYNKLPGILSIEEPSLIHGDLWNGNIMTNRNGSPALIDPAVCFAHREMDLAMTMLFGGLPNEFYQLYNEIFPLEAAWQERMDIYNLYPLLVHVNLFGGGYLNQAIQIVNKYK